MVAIGVLSHAVLMYEQILIAVIVGATELALLVGARIPGLWARRQIGLPMPPREVSRVAIVLSVVVGLFALPGVPVCRQALSTCAADWLGIGIVMLFTATIYGTSVLVHAIVGGLGRWGAPSGQSMQ